MHDAAFLKVKDSALCIVHQTIRQGALRVLEEHHSSDGNGQ